MPLVGNGAGCSSEAGDAEETAFLLSQSDLDSPGPHAAANPSPGKKDDKSRRVEEKFCETSPEMPMLPEGEAEKAFFDVSNSQVNSGLLNKPREMRFAKICINLRTDLPARPPSLHVKSCEIGVYKWVASHPSRQKRSPH